MGVFGKSNSNSSTKALSCMSLFHFSEHVKSIGSRTSPVLQKKLVHDQSYEKNGIWTPALNEGRHGVLPLGKRS